MDCMDWINPALDKEYSGAFVHTAMNIRVL
jgi:hypothetical protein